MAEETKIRVVFILDVIGRPPRHLIESLEKVIDEIDKEKGVTVKMKDIKEPTLMKDRQDFYTTFAEIEVEIDEILYLAILLFKYMPAHIEIISPEILALSNTGWNDVLNELVRRLHGYDEIARVMQIEKDILQKKILELTGQEILTPLSEKPAEFKKEKKNKKRKSNKKK